jgi:hypothetical protein
LLEIAEGISGDIVDEAILVELTELRDRARSAVRQLAQQT